MTQERLTFLLQQVQTGQATPAERTELDVWYDQFENRPSLTDQLDTQARQALEEKMLNQMQSRLDPAEPEEETTVVPLRRSWRRMAAGVVAVLALATLWFYVSRNAPGTPESTVPMLVQKTAYGQTRTFTLPDGSEVTLNGNSSLSYPQQWTGNREVQLTGEAYFKVVHTKDHRRFSVVTADNFRVNVLGTQFTVSRRKAKTRVVLNEGKVQCLINEKAQADSIILKPGQLVEFARIPENYTLKQVDASLYSAWKDHKLILRNTSLKELTEVLEDTYGYRVNVEKASLLDRRMSGSLPTNDVNVLLEGIAEACKVSIRQEEGRIYLTDQSR